MQFGSISIDFRSLALRSRIVSVSVSYHFNFGMELILVFRLRIPIVINDVVISVLLEDIHMLYVRNSINILKNAFAQSCFLSF